MTGAADAFATLTFTYDNDGRLSTDATSGPGTGQPTVTLTYSYDQLGDETSVTDSLSSQGITTYTFNAAQQMTEITTSYGGTAGPQVSFTLRQRRPADLDLAAGRRQSTRRREHEVSLRRRQPRDDDHGRRVDIRIRDGWSTTPLATYVYSYDNANRVTTQVNAEGTYTYTYDNANELTGVYKSGTQTESYSYDLNGNRTGTGYSTTVMNETATSPGRYTYTYDNAGNMITSTERLNDDNLYVRLSKPADQRDDRRNGRGNVHLQRLGPADRHQGQRHADLDGLRRHERRRQPLRRLQRLGQPDRALPVRPGRGQRGGDDR